jgi:hypothetical protein
MKDGEIAVVVGRVMGVKPLALAFYDQASSLTGDYTHSPDLPSIEQTVRDGGIGVDSPVAQEGPVAADFLKSF